MKLNHFTKLFAIMVLLFATSCKKYGYEVPDGYPDDSQNIADGVVDTNMKLIDKTMYAKARVFPGLVHQDEPRVQNAKFTLDLNYTNQTTANLRISVAPQPQFSTGYYAAPGELVKIEVPAGIEGLTVQVGGHTDNLSNKVTLLRDPVIYMRQKLYAGVNYVRNLYGGTIYIHASRAYPNPVEFTITNACVSPDFVLGVDNDADWVAKVRASHVPWLEIRSHRVIFLIPRDKVIATFTSTEPFTNPTAVMTKWNDIFDLDYNAWMGLSDDAADEKDRSPQGAWRGILDIQLSVGYGHSGFPFVGDNDAYWFASFTSLNSLTTSTGQWGTYHEFGHNCQQTGIWSWSTLGETTNNLFNFKVANRIGANFSALHPNIPTGFPQALAFAAKAGPKDFDGTDAQINSPFNRMLPFIQIFEVFGYGAMTHLYTEARHAPRYNPNNLTKHNWVLERLSDYTQTNLVAFFDAWGINYSEAVAVKLAGKYPALTKQVWKYNPLTKTGGTEAIPPPPTIVVSVSCQPQEGTIAALVDNNPATFYHSKYSGIQAGESYPFSFVFSPGSNRTSLVKGMFFNGRPGGNREGDGKDVKVYSSIDNVNYNLIGSTVLPASADRHQYLFPNGGVTAKYFKVVVENGHKANAYVVFGEMNLIMP